MDIIEEYVVDEKKELIFDIWDEYPDIDCDNKSVEKDPSIFKREHTILD